MSQMVVGPMSENCRIVVSSVRLILKPLALVLTICGLVIRVEIAKPESKLELVDVRSMSDE